MSATATATEKAKVRTFSFEHEIPRTSGFKRFESGMYELDSSGEKIPVVLRGELPEKASDRQFMIEVAGVPVEIPDGLIRLVIDQYIYRHGSYVKSTLFDVQTMQVHHIVKFDYSDVLEWAETESQRGTGEGAIKNRLFSRWLSGKLSDEDRETITPEIKVWMQEKRRKQIEKLTGATLD